MAWHGMYCTVQYAPLHVLLRQVIAMPFFPSFEPMTATLCLGGNSAIV